MKKLIAITLTIVALTGCANAGSGAIGGTATGAGAGALLGQALGHSTESTLIGAGIGAAAGALIGTMQDGNRIKADEVYMNQNNNNNSNNNQCYVDNQGMVYCPPGVYPPSTRSTYPQY